MAEGLVSVVEMFAGGKFFGLVFDFDSPPEPPYLPVEDISWKSFSFWLNGDLINVELKDIVSSKSGRLNFHSVYQGDEYLDEPEAMSISPEYEGLSWEVAKLLLKEAVAHYDC